MAQLARPAPAPGPAAAAQEERCDLCGEPVAPRHRHLVDLDERRVLCACRACALLMDRPAAGGGRLRLIPTRRRRLDALRLDAAAWARLRLPVELAFLFHSSAAGRTVAVYPSPLGATESALALDAWDELVASEPALAELEPDVEALLVCRARGLDERWLVPIDDCYALVGALRTRWRGFGGGAEAWQAIERFFEDLDRRAREERR
ncbi:MAG: hypothetical protein JSS99_06415 [Actinobacteria bacterium]|nr:hypothetical protein [Actinomycetota bacterium]